MTHRGRAASSPALAPNTFMAFVDPATGIRHTIKWDHPTSWEDWIGGHVCSVSGIWFPARMIVWKQGRPVGKEFAYDDGVEIHPREGIDF